VDCAPLGHPDRTACASTLAGALRLRYEQTGELNDLDAAAQAIRQAIEAAPHRRVPRPTRLGESHGEIDSVG
jgi:hypothetical protein